MFNDLSWLYGADKLLRAHDDHKPDEPGEQDQIEVRLNAQTARSWKVMNGEWFAPEGLPTLFYVGKPHPKGAKRYAIISPVFICRYF
ncbi:hypothetical protein [Roseovarius litorisediminis]|uniref:hypothetical protein n=1 Tax=Roseovarius litorisediminis TaxID=1312363 RepID=UPI000A269286|nr:hypothetical protein [Roseovarius litorisediminis]